MDCMVESKSKFLEKLRQQEKFEPFGQMVGKFMNSTHSATQAEEQAKV